jgi:hypothetical protein
VNRQQQNDQKYISLHSLPVLIKITPHWFCKHEVIGRSEVCTAIMSRFMPSALLCWTVIDCLFAGRYGTTSICKGSGSQSFLEHPLSVVYESGTVKLWRNVPPSKYLDSITILSITTQKTWILMIHVTICTSQGNIQIWRLKPPDLAGNQNEHNPISLPKITTTTYENLYVANWDKYA